MGRLVFRSSQLVWEAVTLGAIVLSVAVNVGLTAKARRLENAIDRLKGENRLNVGQQVPALEGIDLDGKHVSITFDGSTPQPTLFYVLSPSCGWCYRNTENYKTIVKKLASTHRIVVVSLTSEGLADYARSESYAGTVISGVSDAARKAYHFSGTPQTIEVDNTGKVVHAWTGAYEGSIGAEVTKAYQVALPGLRPPRRVETAGAN